MNQLKQFFYRSLPYITSLFVGVGLYFFTTFLTGNIHDLLINVSASLIAITVILIFYELIKSLSERKLNIEIFEYGKMQVDREVLGVVHQLMKFIYPLEGIDFSQKGVTKFLNTKQTELKQILKDNSFMGFQVFRTWEAYELNIENILKNPLITEKFENDQIITVIKLLKGVRELSELQRSQDVFAQENRKPLISNYKLVKGSKINSQNERYPDRYLLLKSVGGNKFKVLDHPDIPEFRKKNAFNSYKINPKLVDFYSLALLELINSVNVWLKLTGYEFLIDTKMFKMRPVFNERG